MTASRDLRPGVVIVIKGLPYTLLYRNSGGSGWICDDGGGFLDAALDDYLKAGATVTWPKGENDGQVLPSGETRVVNETTGGAKGSKLARFDLLPWDVLWDVAELYGRGAQKYAERNWERGYDWSLSIAALARHFSLFVEGEDIDPETQCHHMTSVIFHAAALIRYGREHPELDNRRKSADRPRA